MVFLAASILQQAEQDKLNLDDDIGKYLIDFSLQGNKVTVRHLLTSTPGIPDYHSLGDAFGGQNLQALEPDEIINLIAGIFNVVRNPPNI